MEPSGHIYDFTAGKAFITIWTRPKLTFEHLLLYYPKDFVLLLAFLGGGARSFDRAIGNDLGDKMPLPVILTVVPFFGGLSGLLVWSIYSGLMSWTGGWLKGDASPEECRTVLAWSMVPSICSLLLLIPLLAVSGSTVFTSEDSIFEIIYWVLSLLLSAWSVYLLITGISLIQNFGTGRAILNMILPGLVILACFAIADLAFQFLF